MSINTTLSSSTPTSGTTNSTVGVSDIMVGQGQNGKVWLEGRAPGGNWIPISYASGAYSVNTSDTTIDYRFNSRNLESSIHVYFGP